MGLLSLAVWTPIAFGIILFAFGRDENPNLARWFALIGALFSAGIGFLIYININGSAATMQLVERFSWIQKFGVYYHLGVDGISLWLILLTSFIGVIAIISSWESITYRVYQYMGAFLVLSGLMIGVFSAQDAMLFYIFFEATLIPMYLIIGIWGGENKIYAAFKFFLYTLLGSLMMLVALVYLYIESGGSFSLDNWYKLPLGITSQNFLFLAFFSAFAVKVPMWPFHTWLPDVHVEAPAAGSAILAAIMLKLGAYGFLRFSLPILPDAAREWAWLMIALSLIAVVYVGLVAMVQQDMKKLVAYSSVAHMGFVILGFFVFSQLGMAGAIVQMISHGFISAAMFLCIGMLYDRVHSREISDYGGVVNTMPNLSIFALLFVMANCGLPGTAGFVGEWMVILAAIKSNFWIGSTAASALIFGAAYSLWMFKRVYFGPVVNNTVQNLKDINAREFLIMISLAIPILVLGVYPKPITDSMNASIANLLHHVAASKLK